ncbi:MAG: hypothetical protein II994_00575 [Lachnospiraceae bacterium]|nr:hypothetical protein [Lachnospiraceae bacterium]
MGSHKKNFVLGIISLLVSAILQAAFSCYMQNNWLILVFACVYAIVFLKYLKEERVVNWLVSRWSKKTLKVIGTIVLFAGIAFLPRSVGQHFTVNVEFMAYFFSYICWMLGLFLLDVTSEE